MEVSSSLNTPTPLRTIEEANSRHAGNNAANRPKEVGHVLEGLKICQGDSLTDESIATYKYVTRDAAVLVR